MPSSNPLGLLRNVKILSVSQFLAAPAAVQYLSDLGADVIKVESPEGAFERTWSGAEAFKNGVSTFFLLSHRNARSLTLNLKDSAGQQIVRSLVETTDVFVQNFRPGVIERFGLGYAELTEIKPDLIYASVSGFGPDGPNAQLPGQDLLLQAMSGIMSITGRDGDFPTPTGSAIVDQHCAALLAMGVTAALFHRERTGEGQQIEATLLQAALDLQLEPLVYFLNGFKINRPNASLGSSYHPAPYGVYETRDGYIALSLSPIALISEALGNPSELEPFLDPAVAADKKEQIRLALGPFLLTRGSAEWIELLRNHKIWCAPVNDYESLFDEPGVKHIDPVLQFEYPEAGTVKVLKHPVRYSSGEPELRRVPPGLGEHTDEILAELGYSSTRIEVLRSGGTI